MNVGGDPYVIEYNVRMGDPETEVVMPRLKTDVLSLFEAMAKGELEQAAFELDDRFCTTVMLVSQGYPGDYEKGKEDHGCSGREGEYRVPCGYEAGRGKSRDERGTCDCC